MGVFELEVLAELMDGSKSFDNFLMMTAALMGVSGADAFGHSVIDLMFFISICNLEGVFVEDDIMIVLEGLTEFPFFSVFDFMNSTMGASLPLVRHLLKLGIKFGKK